MKLAKQYNPQEHETNTYKKWEESGVFSPDEALAKSGEPPYTIMLPPPNVTGSLHMGHALQDTIMDILARFRRLQGRPVLWQPGTDSAALPTNKILLEKLAEQGKTKEDIGREEFLKMSEDWYAETGSEILNQMKRIGCSCDWSRSRFTLDEDYIKSVNEAFIKYYEQGYIYRGSRIVNWDPAAQTTVSDLEIEYKDVKTKFYYFKYGPFEIGTARPETKFGDKYVVMHPDDERYEQYKHGDKFKGEWINGEVEATVIKDDAVDPKFGTGVMTITPWHDSTDFDIAERHNLDKEQIIGFDGKLLDIAGEFAGQDIEKARPQIVKKLEDKSLLVSVDEKYEHSIAVNDRGKGIIEPQIMRQWFMDMDKVRDKTIKVAEEEAVKFIPSRWKKHFINWMENVYDWNINRQIWLGHRLPVWWKQGTHGTDDEDNNFVVSETSPGDDYEQDPDTLDTWFSSALWPFATLNKPGDLEKFYPSSVLVTARDILYLWVARMVFSGLEFMNEIPFENVFIHPTVLAKDGKRMSKSLGTGVDPLELIDEYGADATRFGLMSQMSYDSQAIKFAEADVKAGRNFANKLWNIARLIEGLDENDEKTIADTWIQQRQQEAQKEVSRLIEEYKIGEAARLLYDFVWGDFADWYLEILKVQGSKKIALEVLNKTLIMLHPFMPFITEVLWAHFGNKEQLISAAWPEQEEVKEVPEMHRFQDIVTTIRSARALLAIPAGTVVQVYTESISLSEVVEKMTKAEISSTKSDSMKEFALATGGMISIASEHITQDSINAAKARLEKEITELEAFTAKLEKILTGMRGKADEAVVAEKEAELANAQEKLLTLQDSKKALK